MAENLLKTQTLLQKHLEAKKTTQMHLKWHKTAVYGVCNNHIWSIRHSLHGKMAPFQPYVCINGENIALDFTLHFAPTDTLSGLHVPLQIKKM